MSSSIIPKVMENVEPWTLVRFSHQARLASSSLIMVVVAAFNREKTLVIAIRAILNQTRNSWELLLTVALEMDASDIDPHAAAHL